MFSPFRAGVVWIVTVLFMTAMLVACLAQEKSRVRNLSTQQSMFENAVITAGQISDARADIRMLKDAIQEIKNLQLDSRLRHLEDIQKEAYERTGRMMTMLYTIVGALIMFGGQQAWKLLTVQIKLRSSEDDEETRG